MKAVIVELKGNHAAVLSDDGRIIKIENNNYEIGQEIQMKNSKSGITKKIIAFAATAAACLTLSVGGWAYAYSTPYSYVSLDVNPSIEFTINRFNRVIHVKAVNDDGKEIIQEIQLENLENSTIQDAISKTVNQISELGFFDDESNEENGIVITTASKDNEKANVPANELQKEVQSEVQELGNTVTVEVSSVGLERVEIARELGVTPGKLNLVEKLQAASSEPNQIKLEDWLNKSVKEIMKATKEYKTASKSTEATIEPTQKPEDINSSKKTQDSIEAKATFDKAKKEAEIETAKAEKEAVKSAKEAEAAAKEAQKSAEKANKLNEKEVEKNQKAADKAAAEANKAAEKAKLEAQKAAAEKAKLDEKKNQEAIKATKKAVEEAQKEAKKASDDAVKAAKKAAEEATKAAKKVSEENSKNSKKETNNNNSSTNSSSNSNNSNSNNSNGGNNKK